MAALRDRASSVAHRIGGDGQAQVTRLKWLTIVGPLAFLSIVHLLLHTWLEPLHDFPVVLVMLVWVAAGIAVFSFGVFRVIGHFERRLFEQNQDLAALLAVSRATTSSVDIVAVVDRALDAILEVTSAEAAEVWLASGRGDLTLQRRRGAITELPVRSTRLEAGVELPGIAARDGLPVIVHDLRHEPDLAAGGDHESGFTSYYALPLIHRQETVGVLGVAAREGNALASYREQRLLEGIGEQVTLALANARLHEEVLGGAVLEERGRIGRELHDGLAQVLGYINTQTLATRRLLATGKAGEAMELLEEMQRAARAMYTDVRASILDLRASSASQGLMATLSDYSRDFAAFAGIEVDLELGREVAHLAVPASTEIQLVRIVQEALGNVRKHARATRATVSLEAAGDALVVRVSDDGDGFALDRRLRTGWPRFGLQTMRERAEAVGGEFEITSGLGLGTTVTVRVPSRRTWEAPRAGLAGR